MILAALVVAFAPAAACHAINHDRIYMRDLAAVRPEFASVSPDVEIGFAPFPGQQRVFHPPELRHIALINHLPIGAFSDVCFSWLLALPSRAEITAAMNEALKGRTVDIEIIDQSMSPAPIGPLVFPISGLCGFSAEPVIWRGYVTYGVNQRFSIWAHARVSVKESRLIATEALRSGEPIRANQLRVEPYEGPLSRQDPVTDLGSAAGMIARFDISAGTVLTKNMLDKPKEVERGDLVAVTIQTARTHIEAQGIAEQAGRTGAVITVRNPKTGWKFRARIDEKGKVTVVPGGPIGLVNEVAKS